MRSIRRREPPAARPLRRDHDVRDAGLKGPGRHEPRVIVQREIGVMALAALVNLVLLLRAATTA